LTNSLIKPRVWKIEFCLKKSDMALFVTVWSWDRLAKVLRFYLNFRATSRYLMRLLQIGDWSQQSMEPVHLSIYSSLHLPAGHTLTQKKGEKKLKSCNPCLGVTCKLLSKNSDCGYINWNEGRLIHAICYDQIHCYIYNWLFFIYIYTFQQQNLQRLVLATQKKTILVNSNLREWNGLKTAIWYARATSSFLKYERSGHFFYLDTRTMLVKEKAISVKLAEP
jgi:hypothetical protein